MTKRPRDNCPVCGANVAVTSSGRMWAHNTYRPAPLGGFVGVLCRGTGLRPTTPTLAARRGTAETGDDDE